MQQGNFVGWYVDSGVDGSLLTGPDPLWWERMIRVIGAGANIASALKIERSAYYENVAHEGLCTIGTRRLPHRVVYYTVRNPVYSSFLRVFGQHSKLDNRDHKKSKPQWQPESPPNKLLVFCHNVMSL